MDQNTALDSNLLLAQDPTNSYITTVINEKNNIELKEDSLTTVTDKFNEKEECLNTTAKEECFTTTAKEDDLTRVPNKANQEEDDLTMVSNKEEDGLITVSDIVSKKDYLTTVTNKVCKGENGLTTVTNNGNKEEDGLLTECKTASKEEDNDTLHNKKSRDAPLKIVFENIIEPPPACNPEEVQLYQMIFKIVKYQKIHCTACNKHLGTAPKDKNIRYTHPLLKVLICKNCFDFYTSGEFVKDVDDTELYCRWCGQGGNVLCCSYCSYVFCKKCIRSNCGRRKMNKVKESEEWACFSCKPEQISNLKVKWKALYDYIEEEIRLANECNEPERLSIDYSCCCNDEMAPVKRKFTVPVHSNEYIDTIHTNKKTKLDNSTKSYSETNENTPPPTNIKSELNFLKGDVEDEIICTPDLYLPLQNSEYRDTEETVLPQNASVAEVNPFIPFPSYSQPSVAPAVQPLYYSLPPLPKSGPSNMRNAIANHKTNAVVPNIFAHKPLITNPPIPKLLYFKKPIIKCNIKKKRAIEKNQTIDKQSSSKPVCNLNYDWFQNAFKNTTAINQNLTKILSEISKTPQTISSIEGYTQLHNKYQEILQNTIISLKIIARKLQTDFISDLKKMKFHAEHNAVYQPYSNNSDEDIIVIDADSSISEQSKDKLATENVLGNIAKINSTAFLQSLLDGKFENKMSENRMIEQCMNLTESSANSDNAVNNDIQISKAEQPNKDSSEISDNMKSKRVIENKFESIYKENLNIPTRGIEPNELKRMISVRVMVTTNYDPTIPKMKYFNKFNITK